MKIRDLVEKVTGPARSKRKKKPKPYMIELRYVGEPGSGWFPSWWDGKWHNVGKFAKESDRDHELKKQQRSWPRGDRYEFRAVNKEGVET